MVDHDHCLQQTINRIWNASVMYTIQNTQRLGEEVVMINVCIMGRKLCILLNIQGHLDVRNVQFVYSRMFRC